jgi:hypothetical protein
MIDDGVVPRLEMRLSTISLTVLSLLGVSALSGTGSFFHEMIIGSIPIVWEETEDTADVASG